MSAPPETWEITTTPPPSGLSRWRRLGRLTLKELRETLRDRRTIVTLILMPILVYPLLSIAFQQFILTQAGGIGETVYILGFRDQAYYNLLQGYLTEHGKPLLRDDEGIQAEHPGQPRFSFVEIKDTREALRIGRVDTVVEFDLDTDHEFDPADNLAAKCRLVYLQSSNNGFLAADLLQRRIAEANQAFLAKRLKALDVSQQATPVVTEVETITAEEGAGGVSLTSVIPLILILMTITGAVYPAIDLTAGERERGTLEMLIAAPIPRVGLLIAKYIAVLTVAMLTGSVNLFMMATTISVSGLSEKLLGQNSLSPMLILQVLCLLLLFAMFFSAVLLTLTSFARSFKEAQAYLIPLMLLSLAPGILSLMPGLKLTGTLAVVPLVNIVLLGRDLLQSQVELTSLVAVVVSTCVYSIVAIAAAGKIFGDEGVLYSTQGSWSDLFRRPEEISERPTPTNAMFCLACLFPAYFIVSSLTARAEALPIASRVIVSAVATGLLFGLFPLIAAYAGRVRLLSGFSLFAPRVLAVIGAALIGLSLWPFAHEFTLFTKTFQLDDRFEAVAREIIERVRSINPVALVLAYAVIPATFEEFCFRGYLYNAVRSKTTAMQTVLITALIFGLFHFVTQGALSAERLANSTLLGIVLGWIRYKSGSIWPGIVMHTCHNGFLLTLAHYSEEIEAHIPQFKDRQHLPTAWLVAAGVVALTGFALVQFSTRSKGDRAAENSS